MYSAQMTLVLFQITGLEGFPVCWIYHLGVQLNHLLPGPHVIVQILNPDDGALDAGKAIHGGIAAEQNAVLEHRDMVGRMSGSLDDLKRQ